MTTFERFYVDNDNLALIESGIYQKFRHLLNVGVTEPKMYPICFRIRWILDDEPSGPGGQLQRLQVQYAVDNEHQTDGYFEPFYLTDRVEYSDLWKMAAIADSHDIEVPMA